MFSLMASRRFAPGATLLRYRTPDDRSIITRSGRMLMRTLFSSSDEDRVFLEGDKMDPYHNVRNIFKDIYEFLEFWPVGRSAEAGREVFFIVGVNDKRIEMETRMHVKEYFRRAPDLYPKDIRELFGFYNKKYDGVPVTLTPSKGIVLNDKGILIRMPAHVDDEEDVLISHNDFKKNILPHREKIEETIKKFEYKANRMKVINKIMNLRLESWALDENLMESGVPQLLKTWNDSDGPKHQARILQNRFKITNREVQHFMGTRRR